MIRNIRLLNFKNKLVSTLFVLFSLSAVGQTIISDPGDLQDAVNSATNGGVFIVPDGNYTDFEAIFENVATEANPIIIKAETVGGVTLTGDSHFTLKKSSYITIEGFQILATGESTLIKLEGCNNIRVTRNVFDLTTIEPIKWVFIGGVWDDNTYPFTYASHHNRIDHNVFQNKTTPGHYITVDGSTDASDVGYQSQYDQIDHNHFKNNSPRAVNEQESIRVGWSEMSKSSGFTTVEYNLFEHCDGDPEIVSIKSSDNVVRHNTFISSYGSLSFRHGNRNRAEGNYFFGNGKEIGLSPAGATLHTGGIRIYGTDHVVINNYMEGLTGTIWDAPIALTQGDAIEGSSTNLTKHFRAERVTVAYNTLVNNSHGIEIGYDKPGDNAYNTSLKDITIANNLVTGSENSMVEFINGNDQGEEVTWSNNLMFPTGSATTLVGASTTSFTADMVVNENPNLTFDSNEGVWRSTATTPLYSTLISESVNEDIEGQTRPGSSNPGADHFSMESVRYSPLTETEVGPYAYEEDVVVENYLTLTSVLNFDETAQSGTASIISDLDWTISETEDWIEVNITSGSDNATFNVSVTENTLETSRTGTITVNGGDITRTLTINQEGVEVVLPDLSIPIVNATSDVFQDPNIPANAYDNELSTRWSGEGDAVEIVFELDNTYDVDSLTISFLNGSTRFSYFSIEVSTDGVNYSSIATGLSNSGTTVNEESFNVNSIGSYVKIIGAGNSENLWNSITEINFYGEAVITSLNNVSIGSSIEVFPNPVIDVLNLKLNSSINATTLSINDMQGVRVKSVLLSKGTTEVDVDVSELGSGYYVLIMENETETIVNKVVISH